MRTFLRFNLHGIALIHHMRASSLSSAQEEVPQTPAVHFAQPTQPFPAMPAWSQEKEPARGEDVLDTLFHLAQSTWSQVNSPQEVFAAQVPTNSTYQGTEAPGHDSPIMILLNNELETTMKRPAVRLEPMEQVH